MTARARAGVALAAASLSVWWLAPALGPASPEPDEPEEVLEMVIEVAASEPPPPKPPAEPAKKAEATESESPAVESPEPARRPPAPRPPAPKPAAPRPAAEADEAPARTLTVPGAAELERGRTRIEEGAFPRLRATYGRIGFAAYRDAMLELGGGFFVYDAREREPLAGIDPRSGVMTEVDPSPRLSRWPRDVSRHLPAALAAGRARYGARASRVILLPPASVDAALLGTLESFLAARGVNGRSVQRVDLAYAMRNGRLTADVLAVGLRGGTDQSLELTIDLSRRNDS